MIVENLFTFLSKIFFFTSYVNNKGTFPKPLSQEEEKKYLILCKNGDAEAKDILIRHNLRLVAHIVKKFNNAAEVDDMISVGSIGLIKAINTYSHDKGTQLATYAAKCIENEILMYIRANKKHRTNLSLADTVGIDREGNEITLMDLLFVKEDSVVDQVETNILLDKIMEIIKKVLDKREYTIIKLRYSLGEQKSLTQREVASILGISRSYISRIEKKALAKVRNEFAKCNFN
ncbi:MAG TPA: RNA polymerase sporulation sigma factor SigK [Clostridiales bacterium]|nr:RNA polymerase sporulation sigma factor SigK [Clostridiales bacterium]